MNKKSILTLILSFIMSSTFCACGQYHTTQGGGNGGTSTSQGGGNGGDEQGVPSTVTLYYYVNGVRKLYKNPKNITAIWRGENELHHAQFEKTGVATVYDLDGDYKVTLSGLPEKYTYNPNAITNITTNNSRNIEIELYDVIIPEGGGTDMYQDYIVLSDETKYAVNPYVYRVTVESASSRVHCQFSPPSSGKYSVESWVDVQSQEINPNLDVYTGSFASKYYSHMLDGGGASEGYTTNFLHEVDITESEVGNDFSFAVFAGVKNDRYPVIIDFVVLYNGEPIRQQITSEMIVPKEFNGKAKDYDKTMYKREHSYVDNNGRKLLDGSRFKYNEQTGYYHLYDIELYKGYQETYVGGEKSVVFDDGYGPILHAEMRTDSDGLYPFLDFYYPPGVPAFTPEYGTPIGFDTCEVGTKELTLAGGKKNYRLFVRGWSALVASGDAWITTLSSTEVQKYNNVGGYAPYSNADCGYPVNEEIKTFLQDFSEGKEFFADGEGRGEDYGYDALQEDQWLFACWYYEPI